jgi:glycosyltransferase involved in cell wall biosynthesis
LPYILPLIPVIRKLEEKFPGQLRLLIIANKAPQLNLEFIDFIAWSKKTEVQDLMRMDIGIMPLSDDVWAKGKCGFKALQYMALEIPALVSPVGVNTEIVDHAVNGYWCSSEKEWLECLEKLILHKEVRREMGIAGRKKVISHYSVSSNSSTVLGLFS